MCPTFRVRGNGCGSLVDASTMLCLMQRRSVAQAADLPGAAHLELVDGVIHLDPKPAVLEAMLVGWVRQQQTRFLNEQGTIKPRVVLVRRLVEFTNAYPDLPPMPDPATPSVLQVRPEPPCPGGMAHRAGLCRLLRARPSASGPLHPLPHRAAPHRQGREWRADLWPLRRSSPIRLHLPRMRPRWRDSQRPALLPLCAGRAHPSPPQQFWRRGLPAATASACRIQHSQQPRHSRGLAGQKPVGAAARPIGWFRPAHHPRPPRRATANPVPALHQGCWSTLASFRHATST
jgi:hypothetical protein